VTTTPMTTQKTATARNSTVERVIQACLAILVQRLIAQGIIGPDYKLDCQKHWQSPLCSDVWDHWLEVTLLSGQTLAVFLQTTNYKGHKSGKAEPNKTYEVRETITEALTIRATWNEPELLRTVHFTVGPSNYTYGWFQGMKAHSFDLSVHLTLPDADIFALLHATFDSERSEAATILRVEKEIKMKSDVGVALDRLISQLESWCVRDSFAESPLAIQQAALIADEFVASPDIDDLLEGARGTNIKKQFVTLITSNSKEDLDPASSKVLADLRKSKPLFAAAPDQLENWKVFVQEAQAAVRSAKSLESAIEALWTAPDVAFRGSVRRILMRLQSEEHIDYIQDIGISGVTEHNLYGGNHSTLQSRDIAEAIASRMSGSIASCEQLIDAISRRGRAILRSQLYFEAQNGTTALNSFKYVQAMLVRDGYVLQTPRAAGYDLTGYQDQLTSATVRPYFNFVVVSTASGEPICLLKTKFFSHAEFDRRCKEEGFVGLSLSHHWDPSTGAFVSNLDIPLVMCIDMDGKTKPPSHAVRKLQAMSWTVVFGYEGLKEFLKSRA
jgi:hypothetical protein